MAISFYYHRSSFRCPVSDILRSGPRGFSEGKRRGSGQRTWSLFTVKNSGKRRTEETPRSLLVLDLQKRQMKKRLHAQLHSPFDPARSLPIQFRFGFCRAGLTAGREHLGNNSSFQIVNLCLQPPHSYRTPNEENTQSHPNISFPRSLQLCSPIYGHRRRRRTFPHWNVGHTG
jgi:hypothetical protein